MREMKNSEIEWIGDIPAAWKLKKGKFLFAQRNEKGNLITLQLLSPTQKYGVIPQSLYEELSGMKAVKLSEDVSLTDFKSIYSGDFCISLRSFQGGFEYSQYNGVVSPAYQVFYKTTEDTFDGFYRYMFKEQGFIAYMTSFTKTFRDGKSISFLDFSNSLLPLPPFAEQKKIAEFLDHQCAEIDAVIAKTKASIEEYTRLKQSIITDAVTKGIRGNVPVKDSGVEWIGDIPAHWEAKAIKHIMRESKERTKTGTETMLSVTQKAGIIKSTDATIANPSLSTEDWRIVSKGDIVFNKYKAHSGVFFVSPLDGIVTFNYSVYKCISGNIAKYFEYQFKTPRCIGEFITRMKGVGESISPLYTTELYQVKAIVPPLEEQEEIIAYLDRKCIEVDNLISKKTALLEEMESYKKSVIYEYVTGKKECKNNVAEEKVVAIYPYFPAVLNTDKSRFAQAVLMSKILDSNVSNMGRVKLEKMLFTIEHSLGFDFGTEYHREAAGPLDSSIYKCEKVISRANKWFYVNSSKYGTSYKPQKDMEKYKKYYEQYFSEYNEEIERIISIFKTYSLDQSEIVATLYGAWNDFIIDKKSFTDEDIVTEVLTNWNESKKRFPKDVWLRAIENMRQNNLVPKGYGRHTIIKEVE